MSKPHKGKVPYYERRFEAPGVKSRIVIANLEWSTTDKNVDTTIRRMLKRAFGVPLR